MLPSMLLYGLIIISVINCFYYLIFAKFSFSKSSIAKKNIEAPISAIVYSKNQAEIIPNFLDVLANQTHKNYELILVNNASHDNTRFIFEEFQKKHSNVHIVNVENNETFWGSKKYALTLAIKRASNDHLLFTSPEANITNPDWIATHANLLNLKKQIVVGYTYFKKTKGLFNLFTRFTELHRSLKNFGFGTITKPYTASSLNFAYSKSLFLENKGFSNHMSLFEGAEDLFLRQNATFKNTIIATNNEISVEKNHLNSFSEWFYYKVEQAKLAKNYNSSTRLFCNLFEVSQLLFICISILSLFLFHQLQA